MKEATMVRRKKEKDRKSALVTVSNVDQPVNILADL